MSIYSSIHSGKIENQYRITTDELRVYVCVMMRVLVVRRVGDMFDYRSATICQTKGSVCPRVS